jgi:IS605 OrfB family transposase
MFIPSDGYVAKIKVFIRNTWDWMTVQFRKSDADYITRHCQNRKMSSPTLRQRGKNWYLDFSFEERAELKKTKLKDTIVLGVDLGLNSACACSAMTIDGTVVGRRFLDLPVEKDRLSHILGQIRKSQRLGGRKNSARWAKANGINKHMAQQTAKFIVGAAEKFGADVIVFEHLNFKGEKCLGKYAQKMALWKANEIQRVTADKAHRLGIHISHICARNTSKLAFDGSGEVRRNPQNYSLCKFKTGKQYNCDLSASYNIGARYFIRALLKPLSKKARLDMEAKVPSCSKRITCTLSTLISLRAAMAPSGAVY